MAFDDLVRGRRSIRKYKDKDIPDSEIKELLSLATHAPSSMNGQPWKFIVIRNAATKKKLVEIKNKYCPIEKQNYQADFLSKAPVVVVICVDKQKSFEREIENGVLATANILLGAHHKGLGSVYMSAYRPGDPRVSGDIRQILDIPDTIDPVTIIPLGYPDESPQSKTIVSLDEVVYNEAFGKK
jgi:nitroreductase